LRIFIIVLFLFILSVGFTIVMDLLVPLPLHVSIRNIVLPFKSMVIDEFIIIALVVLYVIIQPIFLRFKNR
jgi:hypothetical protein